MAMELQNLLGGGVQQYSTEEKVVGVWIDGKPLYQRTFTGTMPATITDGGNHTELTIVIPNLSVDKTFFISGCVNNIIPFSSWYLGNKVYVLRVLLQYENNQTKLIIQCNRSSLQGNPFVATFQYTKRDD